MIEVQRVTKRYGATLAVDGVSCRIRRGEIVGFLGPNGAGKSTLLRMISTWLPPTAGTIRVAGFDVVRESLAVRRNIGYLTEHNALYETMRVERFLRFSGEARGLRGARLAERLEWVAGACSLEEVWNKHIQHCSKGFRQRIGLASALLHDPRVILLDEPTHGLDPLQVAAFLDFVRQLAPERAILFSSHVLSEVVAVSSRLLVIHHGRLLIDQAVDALRESAPAGDLEAHLLDVVRSASTRETPA